MDMKLKPEELYKACDPGIFDFDTTEDIQDHDGIIFQNKAIRSLDFGLGMESLGFNIFAIGESGTGKMTAIMTLLGEKAATEEIPGDWCYVYDFKDPDAPIALSLEAGRGMAFQREMDEFINLLKLEIPKIFESKEYETEKNKIVEDFQKKQNEYIARLDEEAKTKGFSVKRTPEGIMIIPLNKEGEVLKKEEFDAFDDETRKKIEEEGKVFQQKLNDVVRRLRGAEKIVRDMLQKLERMMVLDLIAPLVDSMQLQYKSSEKVTAYLDNVREEILSHLDEFRTQEEQPSVLPFLKMPKSEPSLLKYTVNTIVNNGETKGAPVVFESNPTYLNLFGRIEYKVTYGMATTDFTMIRAGSVHKANGGYLVVRAQDLFKNAFSYDALKRALKNGEIKVEDVLEQYRLMSTAGLKPEPIPLDVKVIIIGSPYIYYLLYNLDEESRGLFKVKAEFEGRMARTAENIQKYAAFIAHSQKEEGLLPFDKTGVARIVEYGSRFADHQEKLSARFSDIGDLVRESHYWASKEKNPVITAGHVDKAVAEKIDRVNLIEERIREVMADGTLIVDTSGEKIGQVNGLAVLDLGDYSFGKPSRITAKTYTGRAGIVNIERETKMSGKIHEKAIMIVTSYLGSKYAVSKPISLSASITFEQLYEMIEGDSATCAELYVLLSSISGVPLKQSFAVTGSMDQNGDVQAIGGVNQKIEGFFDLCKLRGLDGSHGVIIPRQNVKHLVLKQEVRDAVADGKFSIYAIEKMEEGLEILTGVPAGVMNEDGTYPEGSVNRLVVERLTEISSALEKKKDKEDAEEEGGRVKKDNGDKECSNC